MMTFAWVALVFVCLCAWMVSLVISRSDLFAPASLLCAGMFVSSLLAVVGRASWNTVEMSETVFLVVLVGITSFLFGCALVEQVCAMGVSSSTTSPAASRPLAGSLFGALGRVFSRGLGDVALWKYAVICAMVLAGIALRVQETTELARELGAASGSFPDMVAAVHSQVELVFTTENLGSDVSFSFLCNQLDKVANVCGFIACFLLVDAFSAHKGAAQKIAPCILVALAGVQRLVSGGRGSMLYWLIALCLFIWISRPHTDAAGESRLLATLGALGVTATVAAVAFWAASALVGREAQTGLVDYFSFYFGCGVPSFSEVIDTADTGLDQAGNLFYGVSTFLYRLGVTSELPIYSIDWIELGEHSSNVFTGFSRFFLAFSHPGVVVFSALTGVVLTMIHRGVLKERWPLGCVFLGMLAGNVFDFAREEYLFSRFLSTSAVANLLILVVLMAFLAWGAADDGDEDERAHSHRVFSERAA